jgi:HPt (histidine-containing phosphotransfer) domain-containing protein
MIPDVPGINILAAMERLGMPWSEFRAMLQQFASGQEHSVRELRDHLNRNQIEQTMPYLHAISANCELVAAARLKECARALERALRSGEKHYEHLYDALDMESSGILRAIKAFHDPHAEFEVRNMIASLYDFGALSDTLLQLKSALESDDSKTAQGLLKQMVADGIPPAIVDSYRQVVKLIDTESFNDAAEIVGLMRENLRA